MDKKEEMNLISQVLSSFKIGHGGISVTTGPSVALYEFEPMIGVRMSKIRNLKDEFAAALKTSGVRVIAPMPGKGTVGIEVPNRERQIVPIEDMLSCDRYINNKMQLPLAIGKTVEGNDFVVDLAEMPHLLVAGATGQGKSVGLNVILASLLRKKSPDELKLVLVDPKQVELSVYEKITKPYLAHLNGQPAICTDAETAQDTLSAILNLMEQRYAMLNKAGVRNISEYNASAKEKMPYYVVVIDEYGDLIMTAEDEMEHIICRLAQKARAVGIHLIISTQRPDITVVTGNIKANFPTRIAFRTTTGTDSRVILDRNGAERLTGKGDMLFFSGAETTRVQCAYISTDEVSEMCAELEQKYADCKETLLDGTRLPLSEEDIEFAPFANIRQSHRPFKALLNIALALTDYYHIGEKELQELSKKGVVILPSDAMLLSLYKIIDRFNSREFNVIVHDKEKIKRIIEWWSK